MQALDGERVRAVPDGTGTLPSRLTSFDPLDVANGGPAIVGAPFAERFPDGVAGDPSAASPGTGYAIVEVALNGLVQFVSEYAAYRASGVALAPRERD